MSDDQGGSLSRIAGALGYEGYEKHLINLYAALGEAIADYDADEGGAVDSVWHELAVSVVMSFFATEEPTDEARAAAMEFCRTQWGYVPSSLEQFLGRQDWLEF